MFTLPARTSLKTLAATLGILALIGCSSELPTGSAGQTPFQNPAPQGSDDCGTSAEPCPVHAAPIADAF